MLTLGSHVHVAEGVLWREMRGGVIILDVGTGSYFQPDIAGASIWRLIETHGRVDAIVQALAAEHDIPAVQLQQSGRLHRPSRSTKSRTSVLAVLCCFGCRPRFATV